MEVRLYLGRWVFMATAVAIDPLPLSPMRNPKVDMGVEQQSNEKVQWLQDAKLGMFIHWDV
jgi:alpha-L-fucosidase